MVATVAGDVILAPRVEASLAAALVDGVADGVVATHAIATLGATANCMLARSAERMLADSAVGVGEGHDAKDELKVRRAGTVGKMKPLVGVGRNFERVQGR